MAVFSVSTYAAEALVLGLATGPVCLASCGPVVLPWMLVQPQGVRIHARQLSIFLGARLAGYLLFAGLLWFAGSILSRSWTGRSWIFGVIQVALAAGLLFYAAGWPHAHCSFAHPQPKLVQIANAQGANTPAEPAPRPRSMGGVALGFLTGINLCPPFLVAGLRAVQLPGLPAALFFFAVFFLGTAVWFVPFVSLGMVRRSVSFLTVARMAAVLLACWYAYSGASVLIEKAVYG
ncbi:MAG: sulfite exporter TauE/SafE family protein [Acidobacteriaceae bacterium]